MSGHLLRLRALVRQWWLFFFLLSAGYWAGHLFASLEAPVVGGFVMFMLIAVTAVVVVELLD